MRKCTVNYVVTLSAMRDVYLDDDEELNVNDIAEELDFNAMEIMRENAKIVNEMHIDEED